MDHLFRDSSGRIPAYSQRTIDGVNWVSPNADCSSIPLEAMEYKAKPRNINPDDIGIGPNGTFLEMEWALEPAWYDRRNHWEAWIPVGELIPSHLQFQFPPIRDNNPEYTIESYHADDLVGTLKEYWNAVAAIINVPPYQDGNEAPHPFDWNRLRDVFPTPEAAIRTRAEAIRASLTYSGFLGWWTTSIHDWTKDLPELTVYKIRCIVNEGGSARRGVLVDLQNDWRELSIAHWMTNDIPIYYQWDEAVDHHDRFLHLSPTILAAATASRPLGLSADITMANTSISRDDETTLTLYDEFLQELELPTDHTSSQLTASDDFSIYWIVDFRGWECRALDSSSTAREYTGRYHWAPECDSIPRFTMWRFRPCYTAALVMRGGIKRAGLNEDCQRSDREIRELFKGALAPRPGDRYNLGGWRLSTSAPYHELLPKRITDHRRTQPNSPQASLTAPNHPSSLLSRMRAQSRDNTPARRDNNSPQSATYTSRWVEEMAKSSQVSSRSSSRFASKERGRRRGRRFANPDPTFSRQGDRSASPQPVARQALGTKEVLRESLVRELRHKGLKFIEKKPTWYMTADMSWNPMLLRHGVLMFWDLESQVRMRYWSICCSEISTLSQIFQTAILHGVRFAIGIRAKDIDIFRPEKLSEMDRLLSSRTYEPGFIETTLELGSGPTFSDRYLGKLADILRRPHARALIGLGGPASWIARTYGDDLVQKFMAGPSLQVTFHEKGFLDSKDRKPAFARCDELTPGELDLVFGHIRSGGGDQDKWVYPTPELLDELCDHWSGQWNDQLEFVFQEIRKELLGSNARPRSRGDWRSFFHKSNRGVHAPRH